MAWIAITDHSGAEFDSEGLGMEGARPGAAQTRLASDLLVPKGTVMIETGISAKHRPQPLLTFGEGASAQLQLNLQALPGGGLTLVITNGDEIQHCTVRHAETARTDVITILYTWDAPNRKAQVAVVRSDAHSVTLFPLKPPRPLLMRDLRALCLERGNRVMAEDVSFFAIATHIERVGPTPTLTPDTPIATPRGYVPVGKLKRGDTILTPEGEVIPVLHRIDRDVPARGSFVPVRLRAPFFGLRQPIIVAPNQRFVVRGSEVEYLFGQEAVLTPARHLAGASAASSVYLRGIVRYSQVLLPGHEVLDAAGTAAESLYVGRIRRKPRLLAASMLADVEHPFLPDHGKAVYPVLRAYDAQVLADYRAA